MIVITLPDNYHPERLYSVEILFEEILGLPYEIQWEKRNDVLIVLKNGNRIIIKDHFFSSLQNEKKYYVQENIPINISFLTNQQTPFLVEPDLPVVYGNSRIELTENTISCDIDVFASTFFMLTRWEEYAVKSRDMHGRFPACDSFAFKNQFLSRPIVNEYAEMLWGILNKLGVRHKRKKRKFNLLLTHDVDIPWLWRNTFLFLKKLGGDLLKRKDWREFKFSIRSYLRTVGGQEKDPYDTFDYLLDSSDKFGYRSHFFFMAGGNTKYDNFYSIKNPKIQTLLKNINQRGHEIGIHPSYSTSTDEALFLSEFKTLQRHSPQFIKGGRQHFLRFEAPYTWQIWENNGLEWDSTLCYPEQAGYRCGICQPFPVFDFIQRKKLRLIERPLTVMDGSYAVYQKKSPKESSYEIANLVSTTKKYGGEFVLLWHNSAFHSPTYEGFQDTYESVLKMCL